MRAVVDNRALAGLNGTKPNVISGASWALGCMTAGLAGILIAPETGMVVENLTLLIVDRVRGGRRSPSSRACRGRSPAA